MQTGERSQLGTIGLLIISGLGLAASLFTAVVLLIIGLAGLFGQVIPLSDLVSVFALAWIAGLTGVLALPAVIYSVLRLLGRTWQPPAVLGGGQSGAFRLASFLLFLWPLALAAGNLAAGMNQLAWLLLPPLHLLAVCLPIWWLIELARRGLPAGSPLRGWGALNTSLFITTPAVIVFELLGLVVLIFVMAAAFSLVPEWMNEMEQLVERLSLLETNPQAAQQIMLAYLQKPAIIFSMLAIPALIVPLLEELFKPLAVWFLLGRQLSPAEGFAAGAICGGSFALIESLMTISTGQNDGWAALIIARAGTGLLHIATTALVSWGLATAWRGRGCSSFLRMLAAYLLAVTLHGLWNALSIIFTVGGGLISPPTQVAWMARLAPGAPLAMLVLVIGLFAFLWNSNRYLRKQVQPMA